MDWTSPTPWLLILAGLAVLAYTVLFVIAKWFSNKLIFPAPEPSYIDNGDYFKIRLANGSVISAVHVINENAKYTVLFSHANEEDIGMIGWRLKGWKDHGFSILTYDYPGYGTSRGETTEAGCYQAVNAAYHYLREEKQIHPENIILYGRSIGSGPTVDLATRQAIAGVILEGAYTSIFRVISHWRILPWDVFNSLAKIKHINAPLLSIHGKSDTTIPFWHGKKLYRHCKQPKSALWINHTGHNEVVEKGGEAYWQAIARFVKTLSQKAQDSD